MKLRFSKVYNMKTPYLDSAIKLHEKALKLNMLSDGGKEALNEFKLIKEILLIHNNSNITKLIKFINSQKDIPDEINEIVNNNFWDLI